jgi:CRP/FNR family transcriptional regulator, cyclic AMP receptor protein
VTSPVSLRETLAAHPFTRGLSSPMVDRLSGFAVLSEHLAGEWIARQDEVADACHLLLDGRAAIEVAPAGRDPLVIATVHGGEVLGWSWLVPPHRWHFDVVALDLVTSIALDAAALREACDENHELGYEITRRLASVMSSRLESARMQLVDIYARPR